MEEERDVRLNGPEWDYKRVHKFEDGTTIHLTTRSNFCSVLQMPEIVMHILNFLEEDPIDAVYFMEALTTATVTRVAVKDEGGVHEIDYIKSPSYLNWLKRVGDYRNYRKNKFNPKANAPTYSDDQGIYSNCLNRIKDWKFYEGRMFALGAVPYYKLFANHWIDLWRSNAENNIKRESIGWKNLRDLGVDYFFYRFGETLSVFNIPDDHGPTEYLTYENDRFVVRDWHCVDCLRLLDVESGTYSSHDNYGKPKNNSDLITIHNDFVKTKGAKIGYIVGQPANNVDIFNIGLLAGRQFYMNDRSCGHENGKCFCGLNKRGMVKRCLGCIHKRWKLVDMFDAWGMIEESTRDLTETQMEIPEECLVPRMLPHSVAIHSKSAKNVNGLALKPSEELVKYGKVSKYISRITKWFMRVPRKYGVEVGEMDGEIRFSRFDRTRFTYIMRLLTMLPVKNFFVPHEYYRMRMKGEYFDGCEYPLSSYLPWPLNISKSFGDKDESVTQKNMRMFAEGLSHYYVCVGMGHAMTYMMKEDVEWIIEAAKDLMRLKKPLDVTQYDWWSAWMNEVVSHLFGLAKVGGGEGKKDKIKWMDGIPNCKCLHGGLLINVGHSKNHRPRPFRYMGWFGSMGTLDPDNPFFEAYSQGNSRVPLSLLTSSEMDHLELNEKFRRFMTKANEVPTYYEEFKLQMDGELRRYSTTRKSHMKMFEIFVGRRDENYRKLRMERIAGKVLEEVDYTVIGVENISLYDITSWMKTFTKAGMKIPELSEMKKNATPSLIKFINNIKGKMEEEMKRRTTEGPNTLWKAQLIRLNYCLIQSKYLIDWDKTSYDSIYWRQIRSCYNRVMMAMRNAKDEAYREKEKKRKLDEAVEKLTKKEKKKKKRKIEKEKHDVDVDELLEAIDRNPALEFLKEFIDVDGED